MTHEKLDETSNLYRDARRLLGIPDDVISSEASIALKCAFDMGYRTPGGLAEMARKMIVPQEEQNG